MPAQAIITGAYGAIGQAIAAGLAHHGFDLVLVGRNEARLKETLSDLQKRYPGSAVSHAVVDLSREAEVSRFAKTFSGPCRVLVNNAVTAPKTRTETPEGIEMQWATNVLGYYWMMHYFTPHLTGQPDARIVNVASYWAGGFDPSDPEFRKRAYTNDAAYRQSKQADRMLTAAFAPTLKPLGISVNSCHPGDVNSKVSNDLGFGGHETPRQGADTPLWLATSPEAAGETGHYVENRQKQACSFMRDTNGIELLMTLCRHYSAT